MNKKATLGLLLALFMIAVLSAGSVQAVAAPEPTQIVAYPASGTFVQNAAIPYPIVDSHLHYYTFIQRTDGFEELISQMDAAGVEKAVLFGTGVVKLWDEYDEYQPTYYMDTESDVYYFSATDYMLLEELEDQPPEVRERIIPFVCGVNPTDRTSVEYLRKTLELYPETVQGIGEILLKHDDLTGFTLGAVPRADSEAMYAIYDLAAEEGLPVLLHSNIAMSYDNNLTFIKEMQNALAHNRDTKIIWAHVGISRRVEVDNLAETAATLLAENDNLYFDISWVVYDDYIAQDDASLAEWAMLIEQYPDRFMIGTDLVGRFGNYNASISRYGPLVDLLSEDTARKLCSENILSLVKTYD